MPPKKGKAKRRAKKQLDTSMEPKGGILIYQRNERKKAITRVPKFIQYFADEYDAWGALDYDDTIIATSGVVLTNKLNAPFYLFGPQTNNTGVFSVNVPSGAGSLLGTPVSSGTIPPYALATTYEVEYEITLVPGQTNTANTGIMQIAAIPTNNASISAMPITVVKEQRYSNYAIVPANMTEPLVLKGKLDIATLFGVSRAEVLNNADYAQPPGADPQKIYYHNVYINGDNAAVINATLQFRYLLHTRFRSRNTLVSTQPSLTIGDIINGKEKEKYVILNSNGSSSSSDVK